MILAFALILAWLVLAAALAFGLVAIARRMCRTGDRDRADEYLAWLESEFAREGSTS